ncbi:MAG TPA: hypothetical protein VF989_07520 [Polyangiaceae bacterium]
MKALGWLVGALALAACQRPADVAPSPRSPASLSVASEALAAYPGLARVTAEAQKAGASTPVLVSVGAGAAGDRVAGTVTAPDTECVLVVARAAASVDDIDLFVYGDDGAVLGSDEGPDKTPALVVCPPHPGRLYLMARIAAGQGIVSVSAQQVEPSAAKRVANRVKAYNSEARERQRLEAWPGLEERLAAHRHLIGASWQDVRRVALPLDARVPTHVTASVDQDRCLDALVFPSDEVSHLELLAMDTDGRIVARASASGRERFLVVCSPHPGNLTFEVRPHAGRGLAVLLLSRTVPGSEADLDPDAPRAELMPLGDLAHARRALADSLEHAGYDRGRLLFTGAAPVGAKTSVPLSLGAGCSRLDVVSGTPLRGISAWLWNEQGALIGHAKSGGKGVLFACGKGERARLDLEALTRAGPVAVELRKEDATPELLRRYPLAAGRLLARMVAYGVIKTASQVGAPRAIQLEPSRLESIDVLVPVGRCVDVTLALGPDASGAEVRLVTTDPKGSEAGEIAELALSRGTYATSARACALGRGTIHARAELRAATGNTIGLVATRMLAPRK